MLYKMIFMIGLLVMLRFCTFFFRNEHLKKNREESPMDNLGLVAVGSIITAGLTIAVGSIGPALGEGRAVSQALTAIAQQPDEANTITRTLFVSLAMIESTAIYCFVVSMILLFANPFADLVASSGG